MKPTFMILGAAKAGTTSLYHYLGQHQDIYMSDPKEPVFFEAEYEKGLGFYIEKYFKGWSGQREVGEARHRNLYLPYVPGRIAQMLPDAKFIVLVRNPIDRAFSHYWHARIRGRESLSFEDALEDNFKRLKNGPFLRTKEEIKFNIETLDSGWSPYRSYVDSGYYAEQIERYIALFGREKIKIIFFEDLVKKPQVMVNDVLDFLNLERMPITDLTAQNKSVSPGIYTLYRGIKSIPGMGFIPSSLEDKLRRALAPFIEKKKPEMSGKTRELLAKHYVPYNKKLEILTGRDLSSWG